MTRPLALVTGASSGIGLAFARRLAATGSDLVVVARNEARLKELAAEVNTNHGAEVEVLPADLTLTDDLERVAARIQSPAAGAAAVDLLVNNAGFGYNGPFAESNVGQQISMVQVNVLALTRLAHAAVVPMTERGAGGIINIASIGAFQPGPHNAVYSATKAFVLSLSEALHVELSGTKVAVTAVCPGLTRTEFHGRGGFDGTRDMPDFVWMGADDVVEAALRGHRHGRAVVTPGLGNKALAAATHLAPRAVVRRLSGLVGSRL